MLAFFNYVLNDLSKTHGKIAGSEFIVAAPTDITEVEKRAFFDLVGRHAPEHARNNFV